MILKQVVASPTTGVLKLTSLAQATGDEVLKLLQTNLTGLSPVESKRRLSIYGRNEFVTIKNRNAITKLCLNFYDPLSGLLLLLGIISYVAGDKGATVLIVIMLLLSVILRWVQELKADNAAAKLRSMVHTTATVVRHQVTSEVLFASLVPGDIIKLSAGDLVPADVRLLESRDLFINQASLTGESLPAEKHAPALSKISGSEFEIPNLCFMGTAVESGSATAVVVATGRSTRFGELADKLTERREVSGFEQGVGRFAWLMVRLIVVMVPLVFILNGLATSDWLQAFLFALAVAVGLTPELLPMIVTVNLAKGAYDMSKRQVIVKRLNAIQNFGAMDILCTDKTGTLTEGKVALIKYIDINGQIQDKILEHAYFNSYYQTGLPNLLDQAVLRQASDSIKNLIVNYTKVDEIPFDFKRRRMTVVVTNKTGEHLLICKGAVAEVLQQSTHVVSRGKVIALAKHHHHNKNDLVDNLENQGFRLIAVAYKKILKKKRVYNEANERDLTLLGFLAFFDPPKPSAVEAITKLKQSGVEIKVLTGDNELVARNICKSVGVPVTKVLLGSDMSALSLNDLRTAVSQTTVFSKLDPRQKEQIVGILKEQGHVVGYLGDGINDSPALRVADVGISVEGATDIAKESADLILLEKSLLVLHSGVREGRRVFNNIEKYLRMAASSSFGNMFSVVGASLFLPFLPMLPLQVITNNLLYDLSQTTIPTDKVDESSLKKPRQWRLAELQKYIFIMGPLSSLFDYATFALLIVVFGGLTNPVLFRTGWFIESLLSQILIIHIIRTNRWPFIQSRASYWVMLSTFGMALVGIFLPYSPLAKVLGLTPLPIEYWLWLIPLLLAYFLLAQKVKLWFSHRFKLD